MSGLITWRGTGIDDLSVSAFWVEKIGWETRGFILKDYEAVEVGM